MPTLLLPDHPNLDHLKRQAKELLRDYRSEVPAARSAINEFLPMLSRPLLLADAQHAIGKQYSFRSWARLKEFVATYDTMGISSVATQLRQAIDSDQLALIAKLLDENPDLLEEPVVRAKVRYRNQRPLTYACQSNRPHVVELLLQRGADPAADGWLAVARSAMADDQLDCLKLLFSRGLDPNLQVYDWGPLLLYPCECIAPAIIQYLLQQGADPNRIHPDSRCLMTPLNMVLGTYVRSSAREKCLETLIAGGAIFEDSVVMDVHRQRLDSLALRLDTNPQLIKQPFYGLDYGSTGYRGLTANGGTLLHLAAEFCAVDAAQLLLQYGADVNARADIDAHGHGGQTPLFHAVSQYHQWGANMVDLLLTNAADVTTRCTIRGQYDKPDEYLSCTVLGYALRFPPDRAANDRIIIKLRQAGARE